MYQARHSIGSLPFLRSASVWGDGCFRFLESLLFSAFTSASSRFKLPILSYEPFLPLHYTIIDQTRQRAERYWGLEGSGEKGGKHSKGGGSDCFALLQ